MLKLEDIPDDKLVKLVREAKKIKGTYLKIVIPSQSSNFSKSDINAQPNTPIHDDDVVEHGQPSNANDPEDLPSAQVAATQSLTVKARKEISKKTCVNCGKVFATRKQCGLHYFVAHSSNASDEVTDCLKKNIFECKEINCNKVLHCPISYLDHVMAHLNILQYDCSVKGCRESFTCRKKLYWHRKQCHRDKEFSCEYCGQYFLNESVLNRHLTHHTGSKLFHCPACPKRFASAFAFRRHSRIHNTNEECNENHQCVCEVCGESYSSHPALIRHLKTHHGPKSHQCETCGKAFHRKCVLNAHKRVHSGEKPFHCATCGLKFSQKSSLQRHDKVHSKLK